MQIVKIKFSDSEYTVTYLKPKIDNCIEGSFDHLILAYVKFLSKSHLKTIILESKHLNWRSNFPLVFYIAVLAIKISVSKH